MVKRKLPGESCRRRGGGASGCQAVRAQPGGAGNGNPPAAASAPSLPLPRAPGRLLTRPLLLPFGGGGGGGGAGGQARGARTKGGGTNTHLRPEQKTAAPGATPVLPGHPTLPGAAAPLSGLGCLRSAGGPPSTVPLSYNCGGDYFPPTVHLTVHTLES
ncbi:hypothetical protein LEMLEM_LOCUS25521 [Lemmus lemmus]